MSSDAFLAGTITKSLTDGIGSFSRIVGFQEAGMYDFEITFSEDSLEAIPFKVEIRSCGIGETETSNRRFCQQCSAATYSFDPKGHRPCIPCPENANCSSIFIRPDRGYWNRFPCSEHIQQCLTKRACKRKDRDLELEEISGRSRNCSYTKTDIEDYDQALCAPGHKGPLCGSCKEHYGKSHSFNCEQCLAGLGNVAFIVLSVLVLMALAGFTTRSNLMSFTDVFEAVPDSSMPGTSRWLSADAELEMMERYYLGVTSENGRGSNAAKLVNVQERAAKRAEMAKWKSVELFKIIVNFVQVTAIAIAINVEWSVLLIGLFEVAEFIGGITSEATNRSADCLMSENRSVPRSVISAVIDLLVPVGLVGLFVLFWSTITLWKKESLTYFLKRSVLSALAVFYISYISTTKTVVNTLSCIEVHDSATVMVDHTTKYWAVDTSLECYEGFHAVLARAVGWPLLILFVLLYPIAISTTIVCNVRQNYEEGWIYDVAGFMYRGYRKDCIFWESIIMFRKALLGVIVVFAYPLGSLIQTVLAVFVLAVSLYLQKTFSPYRKEFGALNDVEDLSLLFSLLTFISSLCFEDDQLPFWARMTVTVFIFLGNVFLFLYFISFFFILSSTCLKAALDKEGVRYRVDGGTLHILRVYLFVYLGGCVVDKCRTYLKGLACFES